MSDVGSETGSRPGITRFALLVALLFYTISLSFADPYENTPDAAARDPDYAAGKELLAKKQWADAAARFTRAAVRDPESADLQNYLGFVHRNLKQFDLAFKHYKQAIALDPRHRGAHEYIGETYLITGDLTGAERHLAALREICLLPCEELDDLDRAVKTYRAAKR